MNEAEKTAFIGKQALEIQRLNTENKELQAANLALQQQRAQLLNQRQDAAQLVTFVTWAIQEMVSGYAAQEAELNFLRGLARKVTQNAARGMDVRVIRTTEFNADLRGD